METNNTEAVIINAPASKSLSHRYMICAALANGESILHNTLESQDLEMTRAILCELGARMQPMPDPESAKISGWKIWGIGGAPHAAPGRTVDCDMGESGTTCRLMTAVLAAGTGLFNIHGQGRMHQRPIGELVTALEQLGARIAYEGRPGCPPLLLEANGLDPELEDGHIHIGMDESSQYFSGLLLAAPLAKSALSIELSGSRAVSWPYVGLTLQCLADFGIRFQVEIRPRIGVPWILLKETSWRALTDARPGCFRVRIWPGLFRAGQYNIEGDWSGASYFLAAGALGKRPVRIKGLNLASLQGDRTMLDILEKMGAHIETKDNEVTVFPSELRGVPLDMGSCPDLVPTVAVLAAFAKGSTRISNVAHLRIKESDRIEAPAQELAKTGVTVDALSDGLLINGLGGHPARVRNRPDKPTLQEAAILNAHNDHRIAMALALLEMQDPELSVRSRLDNAEVVRKSFPDFWEVWDTIK